MLKKTDSLQHMFITFEGLDSSGKTTQAQLLVDDFAKTGIEALVLREPGGTDVSEKIRTILLDRSHMNLAQMSELFLFSAARAQLVSEVIVPALDAGRTVICDRFYDSTTAYQGYGRGLNVKEVKDLNRIATSGTTPDLTLFVDVELAEIRRRRASAGVIADRMESSGEAFYEKVRKGYRAIAAEEPGRVITIDGMRPVEEIHQEIWSIAQRKHSQLRKK
jgi:dTMP kinase